MPNIFLSYSSSDREWAQRVAESLTQQGLDAWLDDNVEHGEDWAEAIKSRLKRSDAVVFLLSNASLDSGLVMGELGAAAALNKPIVALKAKDASLPSPISRLARVQPLDAETSPDEIASTIREKLAA